jgi:hypothetical protein
MLKLVSNKIDTYYTIVFYGKDCFSNIKTSSKRLEYSRRFSRNLTPRAPKKYFNCICRMCEARFRKSLEMSHDTEATSSKRKLRKYDSDQYFTIYRQYFFLKIEHFS